MQIYGGIYFAYHDFNTKSLQLPIIGHTLLETYKYFEGFLDRRRLKDGLIRNDVKIW